MIVLSVDPATSSGWSRWEDGQLSTFGTLTIRDKGRLLPLSAWCLFTAHREPGLLVIEEHTHPRGRSAARALHEARSLWETLASLRGWRVVRVNSQRWQRDTLGRQAFTTAQRKAVALAFARSICERARIDVRNLDSDSADAVCIGQWWQFTEKAAAYAAWK